MILFLDKKLKLSKDVWSFRFKSPEPVIWQAGQFIEVELVHKNPDQRGTKRYFTISSAPFEKYLQITTKFAEADGSSFKKALLKLKPGNKIEAGHPQGNFTVLDFREKMVFMAGGIGITPFRSILKNLDNRKQIKDIILLYANRNQEIVFQKELDKLAHKNDGLKIYYFIEPEIINQKKITPLVMEFNKPKYFISGPYGMVKAISDFLKNIRVEEKNLIYDYFPGY